MLTDVDERALDWAQHYLSLASASLPADVTSCAVIDARRSFWRRGGPMSHPNEDGGLLVVGLSYRTWPTTFAVRIERDERKPRLTDSLPMPERLCQLENVSSLIIADVPFSSLPDAIGQLSLLELRLNKVPINCLPDGIGNLVNLVVLTVDTCPLVQVPEQIGMLGRLHQLTLRECQLETLPLDLCMLDQLWYLDVQGNRLTSLPDISSARLLHLVTLSRNEFTRMPVWLAMHQGGATLTVICKQTKIPREQRIRRLTERWPDVYYREPSGYGFV